MNILVFDTVAFTTIITCGFYFISWNLFLKKENEAYRLPYLIKKIFILFFWPSIFIQVAIGCLDQFAGVIAENTADNSIIYQIRNYLDHEYIASISFVTDFISSTIAYYILSQLITLGNLHIPKQAKQEKRAIHFCFLPILLFLIVTLLRMSLHGQLGSELLSLKYILVFLPIITSFFWLYNDFSFKDINFFSKGIIFITLPLLEPMLGNAFQFLALGALIFNLIQKRTLSTPKPENLFHESLKADEFSRLYLASIAIPYFIIVTAHLTPFPPINSFFSLPATGTTLFQIPILFLLSTFLVKNNLKKYFYMSLGIITDLITRGLFWSMYKPFIYVNNSIFEQLEAIGIKDFNQTLIAASFFLQFFIYFYYFSSKLEKNLFALDWSENTYLKINGYRFLSNLPPLTILIVLIFSTNNFFYKMEEAIFKERKKHIELPWESKTLAKDIVQDFDFEKRKLYLKNLYPEVKNFGEKVGNKFFQNQLLAIVIIGLIFIIGFCDSKKSQKAFIKKYFGDKAATNYPQLLKNSIRARSNYLIGQLIFDGSVYLCICLLSYQAYSHSQNIKKIPLNWKLAIAAHNLDYLLLNKSVDTFASPIKNRIKSNEKIQAKQKKPDSSTNFSQLNLSKNMELIKAAKIGDANEVNRLLSKGADINFKDEGGYTPLIEAVINEKESVVKLLLEKGANPNSRSYEEDSSVLSYAYRVRNLRLLKMLITHGANVNFENAWGRFILYFAASNGELEIAKLLIENGADVNKQNFEGESALMGASSNGEVSTLNLLISNGATINLKNLKGKTAYDLGKSEEIKTLLLLAYPQHEDVEFNKEKPK